MILHKKGFHQGHKRAPSLRYGFEYSPDNNNKKPKYLPTYCPVGYGSYEKVKQVFQEDIHSVFGPSRKGTFSNNESLKELCPKSSLISTWVCTWVYDFLLQCRICYKFLFSVNTEQGWKSIRLTSRSQLREKQSHTEKEKQMKKCHPRPLLIVFRTYSIWVEQNLASW